MSPDGGATEVGTRESVQVTFSEAVDPNSLTNASFVVAEGTTPIGGVIQVDGDTATFTPSVSLTLMASHTVILTQDIKDLAGNPLFGAPITWSFSTRDGTWDAPTPIEDNPGSAGQPSASVEVSGRALVIWPQADSTSTSVYAARLALGTPAGAPALLSTIDTSKAITEPRIATDLSGNALAVWRTGTDTRTDLRGKWLAPDSSTWGGLTTVALSNADISSAQIGLAEDGSGVAVWTEYDGSRYNIWAKRFVPGTGWSSAAQGTDASRTGRSASELRVSTDSRGNAVAVWLQFDGIRNRLWANRYSAEGAWETASEIPTGDVASAFAVAIAAAPSGDAVAVWAQSDGTRANIWAARYSVASRAWGSAALVETDDAGNAVNPQVAVNSGGDAVAVWEQSDGQRRSIKSSRYNQTTDAWEPAELLETNTQGDASLPQVAMDGAGNTIAVWHQYDGTEYNIWANRLSSNTGQWNNAIRIGNSGSGNPRLAMNQHGTAVVVWSTGVNHVWMNSFRDQAP